jgi:hypothetical protein
VTIDKQLGEEVIVIRAKSLLRPMVSSSVLSMLRPVLPKASLCFLKVATFPALNHAATLTLCSSGKASHFSIMLLLVSSTADHGMILRHARAYPASGCRTRCLASQSRLFGAMSSCQEPRARRARWQADVAVLAAFALVRGF